MNEEVVSPPAGDAALAADLPELEAAGGFGRPLAEARAAQGLSVAEVAQRLRLHPKQVAALEEERLDALPEPAFVRGFLRNYAKELKLDPAPLLAELLRRQPASGDMPTLLGGPPADVRRAGVERASRLTVIGGALLLLVVLGIVGWVASLRVEPAATPAPAVPAQPAAAPAAPPAVGAPGPASTPAAPAATEPVPAAAPPDPKAEPKSESAAEPKPEQKPATAGAASLRLLVGERPSWIEITQADGRVLLTGLQEARTERLLGPVRPPLRLVIGNASTVSLEYRGREVDLKPHVRANDLARLSLE